MASPNRGRLRGRSRIGLLIGLRYCCALAFEPALRPTAPLQHGRGGDTELPSGVASSSPIDSLKVRGRTVLVKRDDNMRLTGSGVSGNKARKLYALNAVPPDDFPKLVVSHGGPQVLSSSPFPAETAAPNFFFRESQSNAMVAMAAVVASKPGAAFRYYTKPVPRWLRQNPSGNFARALALGTEVIEVHPADYEKVFGGPSGSEILSSDFALELPPGTLRLPQGGAAAAAEEGCRMLADEIWEYWSGRVRTASAAEGLTAAGAAAAAKAAATSAAAGGGAAASARVAAATPPPRLLVAVPAGTGTTALFLARHLAPRGVAVAALPCVGDADYLLRQVQRLDAVTAAGDDGSGGNGSTGALGRSNGALPRVLRPRRKAAFGEPREELLKVWRELEGCGLYVDLLYGARAWEILFDLWDELGGSETNGGCGSSAGSAALKGLGLESGGGCQLMYVHSGGRLGDSSQLTRYKHKGLVGAHELQ